MSKPDFTKIAVERQVKAMGCDHFEVGILNPNFAHPETGNIEERMIIRSWSKETLLQGGTVDFLKAANAKGNHIYIRPAGEHGLTLVDDIDQAKIADMKKNGFQPALVVETSPGNHQAWLKNGKTLPSAVSTEVARVVAKEFDADQGSADWRHFGRLAGFTNRKLKYQGDMGQFPFCRLREASGVQYDQREAVVKTAETSVEKTRLEQAKLYEEWQKKRDASPNGAPLKGIESFRQDPKYGGDQTRVDMAYATYASSRGVEKTTIAAAIASRDLSHKGSPARQADYIERTIQKSVASTRGGLSR